jgi:hypothetical protein
MIECVGCCDTRLDTYLRMRLTYNAALAELTSLEEMMHYMMLDDQIYPDAINKLWQACSKHVITLF